MLDPQPDVHRIARAQAERQDGSCPRRMPIAMSLFLSLLLVAECRLEPGSSDLRSIRNRQPFAAPVRFIDRGDHLGDGCRVHGGETNRTTTRHGVTGYSGVGHPALDSYREFFRHHDYPCPAGIPKPVIDRSRLPGPG